MGLALTTSGAVASSTVTAEDLCRLYAASVCRFAAMVAPSVPEAEDIAQDALTRAIRSLASYDSARGTVESWLWRIVANAAKDSANRRQRFRDAVARIGLFTLRESSSIEDDVLIRIRDAELHAQIRALPIRDRTLIALRFGADLEMSAVGDAVGLSPDSAARALRRALARLRLRLEGTQT